MQCPGCATIAAPGAKFCGECGTALPTACPACGASIVAGAKFCVECGTKLTPVAAPAILPPPPTPPPPTAGPPLRQVSAHASPERRLVSVLFCDLVDSTSLSTEIDLEDYREVLGAYHRAAAEEVERVEGFVAKYMGDGVLAYFGYPTAREDDAERAIRAGLAICTAVEALTAQGSALRARVGVATGPVIVGDLLGTGSAQERGVSGETPNLAARLQGLAQPGQVVISALTHGLTGGLFDYEDLGEATLKGFARPQQVFQVLSTNESVGRFEALRSSRTPLVGREEELELLLRRWDRTTGGESQVVLISAEPGVGKSRLVSAFRARIGEQRHADLAAYCAPHGGESAFHPVIRALEARCGFASTDAPAQKLARLRTLLAETGADADPEAGPLIGGLLSLPVDGVFPPLVLSPQRIKDQTIRVLTPLMMSGLADGPTLTVFEDVHWADPSTLELLRSAVRDAQRGPPSLLLVTFRPEFQPPQEWLGRPDVTALTLTRLRPAEAEVMVTRIAEGRRLPVAVVREILERAEGVPLFLEEITRAVLDTGEAEVEGAQPRVVVPATLQASLAGRLDRLGEVKELAQVGAAIGREFGVSLLQAVVGWPASQLTAGLAQLVEADVIFPVRGGEDQGYIFKHALVQDVAYAALLRSQRHSLHGRIADAMAEHQSAEVAARPERHARHLSEAARPREALDAWRRAAVKTFGVGSWREGLSQLDQAMRALAGLPDGEERDRLELDLQMITGGVSQGAVGHSAPGALKAYERAYVLAKSLGETRQAALAGGRVWIGAYGEGDLDGVLSRLGQIDADLSNDADDVDRALVQGQMVTGHLFRGAFPIAAEMSRKALAVLEPAGEVAPPEYHYMSPLTSPQVTVFCSAVAMGQRETAQALATKLEHSLPSLGAMSRVISLTMLIYNGYLSGDWDGVIRCARLMTQAVGEIEGAAHYLDLCRLVEVRMAARTGDHGATAAIDATLERPSVAYAMQHLPRYLMIAGDAHADLGNIPRARACFEEALKGGPFGSQRWLHSELQRRVGDLFLAEGDRPAARTWFETASETARGQDAALFELRAALRIALLDRQDRSDADCAALLDPICARVPEPCSELDAARAMCGRPIPV